MGSNFAAPKTVNKNLINEIHSNGYPSPSTLLVKAMIGFKLIANSVYIRVVHY